MGAHILELPIPGLPKLGPSGPLGAMTDIFGAISSKGAKGGAMSS